jgi:uncharacterized membrane protein
MPEIGAFHPQIVHFVIGLLVVGVVLRLVSFARRSSWMDPAAMTLLLIGTLAAAAAVRSGLDAHGPVERIPGARPLVEEHEEDGRKTRNIFIVVSAIELVALALAQRASFAQYARYTRMASAVVGVYGGIMLYDTSEHGGELVYSYGGGPGLRTRNAADVDRVLIAALYNKAQAARAAGESVEAAVFVSQLTGRMPAGADAQLLVAESQVMDMKDYASALATLASIRAPAEDARMTSRVASLRADAFLGLGQTDSARVVLRRALSQGPNPRLQAKLDSIK